MVAKKSNIVRFAEGPERCKFFADKHTTEKVLVIGYQVYLKLQPYKQAILALRKNLKLATKYYSPFTIVEKVDLVAYKLQLSASSTVHHVLYVSLLKKKVGVNCVPKPFIPLVRPERQLLIESFKVLDCRIFQCRSHLLRTRR